MLLLVLLGGLHRGEKAPDWSLHPPPRAEALLCPCSWAAFGGLEPQTVEEQGLQEVPGQCVV